MIYNTDQFIKDASSTRLKVFIFVFSSILLLVVLSFSPGCHTPPDLSSCTRLEVQYHPSTLEYFIRASDPQNLLSPEEKKYLESLEIVTVTDQERIKDFARDVSIGSFRGLMLGNISFANPVYINCYRDNKHVIFFDVFGDAIATKDRRWFRYPRGLPNLEIIESPQIRPFKLRNNCALNMERLYTAGPLYQREVSSYPESTDWCDAIMRDRINSSYVNEERMRGYFKCPTAGEGKCHYAMNPKCKVDSPADMVLLFETKAGWNQHGGPELFTFDNHEPKGGCVLLNDGTVKFIRTKEELRQLRWK